MRSNVAKKQADNSMAIQVVTTTNWQEIYEHKIATSAQNRRTNDNMNEVYKNTNRHSKLTQVNDYGRVDGVV